MVKREYTYFGDVTDGRRDGLGLMYYGSREGAVRSEGQVRGQFGYWKDDMLHGVVVDVVNDKLIK